MIPILYDHKETEFLSNGICRLSECLRCIVHEERNGVFECEFDYPITGTHYKDIQEGCIIACTHDDKTDIQPFDIYGRSAPLDGVVTFYAHHISYRLGNVILEPYSASSCVQAFATMNQHSINQNDFTFWTDKDVTGNWGISVPTSCKEILGGVEGSILDVFGTGEYEWNKWTVKLHSHRGRENVTEIRYGKNLMNLVQDIDISSTYNAVAPFWKSSENDDSVYLPEGIIVSYETPIGTVLWTTESNQEIVTELGENIVFADGSFEIKPVAMDLSYAFEEMPTVEQLRNRARTLLEDSEAWLPHETIEVDFVALWQTEEYKNIAPLQRISLCDSVTVIYPELGVNSQHKVVSYDYNVLLDRYDRLELGKAKTNFSDIIMASTEDYILKKVPSKSFLERAVEAATNLITGGLGGHVVINTNANGQPNEILILDTEDKETAVQVLRINMNGIGFSSNGYNGPYRTAWTLDGHFVADFIDTGTLTANLLRGGIITDLQGKNYWNLETGEISISLTPGEEGEVTQADLARVENNAKGYANSAEQNAKNYIDGKSFATENYVTGAIQANNTGLRTEFTGIFSAKGDSVTRIQTWYYQSSSPVQLFGGEWVTTPPVWRDGTYQWTKQRYIKDDGTYTESEPVCETGNSGKDGQPGRDGANGLHLYITSNSSTSVPKESSKDVVLTACVGKEDEVDIDPTGTIYKYSWYVSKDGSEEYYFRSGKTINITINKDFCDNMASVRFAIVETTHNYITNQSGDAITDSNGNPLEVE